MSNIIWKARAINQSKYWISFSKYLKDAKETLRRRRKNQKRQNWEENIQVCVKYKSRAWQKQGGPVYPTLWLFATRGRRWERIKWVQLCFLYLCCNCIHSLSLSFSLSLSLYMSLSQHTHTRKSHSCPCLHTPPFKLAPHPLLVSNACRLRSTCFHLQATCFACACIDIHNKSAGQKTWLGEDNISIKLRNKNVSVKLRAKKYCCEW